jgi:quinol monooxygenase YgiN
MGTESAALLDVIRLTLTITTSPGESSRLVEALRSLMEPTRADSGCIGCELALSAASDDPPQIRYVEEWSSEEELRTRVRSDRFLRLVAVMEAARSAPQLTFALASGARGLDYVAEVRRDLTRER